MDNTATKLDRIITKARREPKTKFTYLKYLLNEEYLFSCYQELKPNKAAGVDGRTVESYTKDEIIGLIRETIAKMKKDQYIPQPIRRVWIPKENGKKRALGIPTVIDKIIQLGCGKIISGIWEPKFLPVSFGYRPGKDAHACLKEINHMIMSNPVNYIVEADIEGFFDHVNHNWMRKCLEEHIRDPRFNNLISQLLKAGVLEKQELTAVKEGTPQGGIISPILANVYLHYVLDLWFEKRAKRKSRGYVQLIRYADDFVIGCQSKEDAIELLKDIKERFSKFSLALSPEKTQIIEFGRFADDNRRRRGEKRAETFDFLGFTQYCDNTRDGRFSAKMKTSKKRMKRSQQNMHAYLKQNRSRSVKELWGYDRIEAKGTLPVLWSKWKFQCYKYFPLQNTGNDIQMVEQAKPKAELQLGTVRELYQEVSITSA